MIEIEFKKIGKIKVKEGSNILELIEKLDEKIARQAIAAELTGGKDEGLENNLVDLDYKVNENSNFNIITPETGEKANDILNHSSSHIMAAAIKKVFPDAKFAIGPAIKEGFYYDFETKKSVAIEDLSLIEEEMKKIIKSNCKFERSEISKQEAKILFKDNPYKIELI
ncbi:MAG: threonine--tRNA ligase, partial [Actinobacteria bacterium]|nr:threonine--tRNA ligase [Actinomycetota bacterium]